MYKEPLEKYVVQDGGTVLLLPAGLSSKNLELVMSKYSEYKVRTVGWGGDEGEAGISGTHATFLVLVHCLGHSCNSGTETHTVAHVLTANVTGCVNKCISDG